MVTSTPLENLFLLLYEPQNKNFHFGITKTLILHARSIFFRGGHITKIWSKKILFMKTLSKLGALTVHNKPEDGDIVNVNIKNKPAES